MKLAKSLPWIAGALALAGAGVAAYSPSHVRGFDLDGFARIPVLEGGRLKPIDSVARNALLVIRSQQSFRHQGRTVSADEWLLDVMFRPQVADQQPVFEINDPDVLGLVGIRQTRERYFSFAQLLPGLAEIQRQANLARPVDPKQRDRFQSAIVNLFDRVYLYHRLKNTVQVEGSPGLAAELGGAGTPGAAERLSGLAQLAYFRPLPPPPGAS